MSKYAGMSDIVFIELLESKLQDASWNVGEMVELEQRGISIVEGNPDLLKGILKKRAEFTSALNKALEPYSRNFQILGEAISKFKNLQVGSVVTLNPEIESKVFSAQELADDFVSREVANVLKASHGVLEDIHKQGTRDWFDWSIFAFTLIAAAVPILIIILA